MLSAQVTDACLESRDGPGIAGMLSLFRAESGDIRDPKAHIIGVPSRTCSVPEIAIEGCPTVRTEA